MNEGGNSILRTRIEKAAADSGYERSTTWSGNTATLRSVYFPEYVVVLHRDGVEFSVSVSNAALLPIRAYGGVLQVSGWAALYEVLGKVSAAARTLPNRVTQQFLDATEALPKSTEAERWVVQRVGQELFRASLLEYWQGRCCVTGLAVQGLLRASHIKPWSACESDQERLDVFNGFLLAPHVDALFDGGWVSFSDEGLVLVSPSLSETAQRAVGFSSQWKVAGLLPAHGRYLAHHRQKVWRGGAN